MKKVTKFEANDGRIFDTEEAALAHEKLNALSEWYYDNKLYGKYEGSHIDWDDFLEWIEKHNDKLKEIIAACQESGS